MQLTQYARGVKTFKKSDILKDIVVQEGFLDSLSNTLKLGKSNDIDLTSIGRNWVLIKAMDRDIDNRGIQIDAVDLAATNLRYWGQLVKACGEEVRKMPDTLISGETLTIKQAAVLQVLDQCNFYCTFLTTLTEALLSIGLSDKDPANAVKNTADIQMLNKTWMYFNDLNVGIFNTLPDILKRLKNAPDVEIDESTIDILGKNKGELAFTPIPTKNAGAHVFLPMYWVKSMRMELDLARISSMTESNEQNAMKIEQLMNRRTGQNDVQLDRQIEIYQSRIIKNRSKIDDIYARYERKEPSHA